MISTMWSQGELNIEWSYASFRVQDGTPYPFASLDRVDIDYGDGSSFSTAPMESGSESYRTHSSDATTEHLVTVQYDGARSVNDLSFTFDENDGIQAGEDGEEYHTSYFRPYEDYSYCQLKASSEQVRRADIIDRFIGDEPFGPRPTGSDVQRTRHRDPHGDALPHRRVREPRPSFSTPIVTCDPD